MNVRKYRSERTRRFWSILLFLIILTLFVYIVSEGLS